MYVLLLFFLALAGAELRCDHFQYLELGKEYRVYNYDFWNQYKGGEKHCTWQFMSPYITKINCTIDVPSSDNCTRNNVAVQFAGNDTQRICGLGMFNFEGINATITFKSLHYSQSGEFVCQVRAEKPFNENNCECGWKNELQLETRIVNGTETDVNEFPMMAGIVYITQSLLYCGATIISNRYVITAAHCIRYKIIPWLGILVGEHDVTRDVESKATKLYHVKKCVIHPHYRKHHNDVAICTTVDTIKFSREVGPACLPFRHKQDSFAGSIVTALGWGLLTFNGYKATTLQKVDLNAITHTQCSNYYSHVTHDNICTYTPGKDSCQMDSGGPILWRNPTTKNLVIVGIIAHGIGCATEIPAVAMRIGAYLDWILSVTPDAQYCKVE